MKTYPLTTPQSLIPWRALAMLGMLLVAGNGCTRAWAQGAPPAASETLPFTASVTIRPWNLGLRSLYIDSPLRAALMDGEVWVLYATNPYNDPITITHWKGPDFEHIVRQPDSAADFPQRTASSFINSGLWFDQATGTLYALMHGEYEHRWPGSAWCRKKTWLVTSRDRGLHWTFVGDVLTGVLPRPMERTEYSGSEFEMGPADYDLYVDTRGGYFYVTSWNGFAATDGILNHFTAGTVEVARCAIRDKMAPGKWYKFKDGTWTEPGLGGKASRVGMTTYGIYGNTIYSTYLQKYVRIGVNTGVGDPRFPNLGMRDNSVYISTCTDLSKQDWTPMAKLVDDPGNPLDGFTLTAEDGVNQSVAGQKLHAYSYWEKSGRILDVTFAKGTMKVAPFPPYGSYSYEPHPESGDRIESRQTRIVGAGSPEMHYGGSGWSFEANPDYYRGRSKKTSVPGDAVEFSFRGAGIYWRAIAAPDGGKADVFIDHQLQRTVDLFFGGTPQIFEFAFIKTGLDPSAPHTIRIVARNDRNPNSRGTVVNHMAFEYSAESYAASAGYSRIAGKNHWRYQGKQGADYSDLTFNAASNCWLKESQCIVGNNYQAPLPDIDAVRKWVAPHDGRVRIEGAPAVQGSSDEGVVSSVLKNANELWSAPLAASSIKASSYDTTVAVRKGDVVSFVVRKREPMKDAAAPPNPPHGSPVKIGVKELTCSGPMNDCSELSKFVVHLPGAGKTFSAMVGLAADNVSGTQGSVVFSVIVGGKTAFNSAKLKPSKKAVSVNVDLAGAREFVLEVSNDGDDFAVGAPSIDWANWAEAKAILANGKEIWLSDLHLNGVASGPRVLWDPVVTYVDSAAASQ